MSERCSAFYAVLDYADRALDILDRCPDDAAWIVKYRDGDGWHPLCPAHRPAGEVGRCDPEVDMYPHIRVWSR